MQSIAWFATVLVAVAGFGVSALVWFAMDSTNDDLANFLGWDGMHFDE